MRKLLIILIFLLLPILSAVEVDMKSEFNQGETLIAKVSGNFIDPILKENIFFYRGHVRVPMEYNVVEIDDEFYIYALLGNKQASNYSINIEEVRYMKGVDISEEDIILNFTITENTADFSVNPGFIITEIDFSLEVQNLQDFKITIEINENSAGEVLGFFDMLFKGAQESENTIELKSGEIKELEFNLGNETSFRIVELKTESLSYEIPIYAFVTAQEQIITISENQSELEENITEDNQEENQENTIIEEDDQEEILKYTTSSCAEVNGTICEDNEKCSETSIQARDATCCPEIGTCEEIEKTNTGKIIGWSMIIVILVVLFWFFKSKYKGAKKEINLFKIAKGKKK